MRAKVPRHFYSWERKFQETKVPGYESSTEQTFHSVKVPPMELFSQEQKYVETKYQLPRAVLLY